MIGEVVEYPHRPKKEKAISAEFFSDSDEKPIFARREKGGLDDLEGEYWWEGDEEESSDLMEDEG